MSAGLDKKAGIQNTKLEQMYLFSNRLLPSNLLLCSSRRNQKDVSFYRLFRSCHSCISHEIIPCLFVLYSRRIFLSFKGGNSNFYYKITVNKTSFLHKNPTADQNSLTEKFEMRLSSFINCWSSAAVLDLQFILLVSLLKMAIAFWYTAIILQKLKCILADLIFKQNTQGVFYYHFFKLHVISTAFVMLHSLYVNWK